MLSLTVLSIKNGSCGTIDNLSLKYSKFIDLISSLSIKILPFFGSIILDKDNTILLFPLPVLPTIPILSPGFISKFTFFNINGVSGL